MTAFALEALLKRDTFIVVAALAPLALLCWLAVLTGAGTGMDPFAMTDWAAPLRAFPGGVSGDWPRLLARQPLHVGHHDVAMMLPSAAPTILLYGRVVRQAERKGQLGNAACRSRPSPPAISHCGFLSARWR
jgi:predicted metal-binding membrane protein